MVKSKMAEIDMQMHWPVAEVLDAEGAKASCAHKHLWMVCDEAAVDVSTVQWWVRWVLKKPKQEEQLFMTNWGMVTLALQWSLQTYCGLCTDMHAAYIT
jgi:hypothetical protein